MSRSEIIRTASNRNARMTRSVVSMSMVSNSSKGTELLPTRTSRADEAMPVPYRLPKLSQPCVLSNRAEIQVHDGKNKIYSRVGYNNSKNSSEDVDALVWKIYVPPKSFVQQMRQSNLALPQFRDAVIAPSLQTHDFQDLLNYKRLLTEKTTETGPPKMCPPTTPVSRSQSGRKSGRSLRWTLGPERHASFDKKGQGRAQGPYSREFTVTCMPPNNWLKMKLGRIPTMAVSVRGY